MLVDLVGEGTFEGKALELDEQDGREPRDGQLFRGFAEDLAVRAFPSKVSGRCASEEQNAIVRLTRHQTSP